MSPCHDADKLEALVRSPEQSAVLTDAHQYALGLDDVMMRLQSTRLQAEGSDQHGCDTITYQGCASSSDSSADCSAGDSSDASASWCTDSCPPESGCDDGEQIVSKHVKQAEPPATGITSAMCLSNTDAQLSSEHLPGNQSAAQQEERADQAPHRGAKDMLCTCADCYALNNMGADYEPEPLPRFREGQRVLAFHASPPRFKHGVVVAIRDNGGEWEYGVELDERKGQFGGYRQESLHRLF